MWDEVENGCDFSFHLSIPGEESELSGLFLS